MPEAIVFLVDYLAVEGVIAVSTAVAIGAFAATYGTFILIAGSLAYSSMQAKDAGRAAREKYNAAQVDRNVNVSSSVAIREMVLGRVRKGGAVFFKGSTGAQQRDMYLAIAIAGHEIDAIEAIYLNDELVTLDADGYVNEAPYAVTATSTGYLTTDGAGVGTLPSSYIAGSVSGVAERLNTSGPEFEWEYTSTSVAGLTVTTGLSNAGVTYQYRYFASNVQIFKHLGQPGQAVDAALLAAFPSDWVAANIVTGVAYVVIKATYSETSFPNGMVNVTSVIRGAKLYDPRSGLTAWSENPALMMRHIYSHPKFGKATPNASEDSRFIAAANACDSSASYMVGGVTSVQKLYRASVVVPFGTAPRSALDDLSQAMGGAWAFAGGEIYLRAGVYTAPVMSINDDDLAVIKRNGGNESQNPISISVHQARNQKINTVKVKIWDQAQDYKQVSLTPLSGAALLARDGVELVQEITYPAIGYAPQALHVAGIMMRDARDPLVVNLPLKLRAYPLELFDTVDLTLARYGWTAKTFTVMSRAWNMDGSLQLTLKETSASITQMDATFQAQGFAPNTNLPKPWQVATVGALTVTSGTAELIKQLDGTIVSRMRVSWPQVPDAAVQQAGRVEVQYRLASSGGAWTSLNALGDDTTIVTSDVQDGAIYVIRARAKNTLVPGDWGAQTTHQVIGKTEPPSNVASISGQQQQFGIVLTWPEVTDIDASYYEIRVDGTSWAAATLVESSIFGGSYSWKIQTAGVRKVWIKAFDTSGNTSAIAASTDVTVAPPSASTSLGYSLSGPDLVLAWATATTFFIIDRYEIRYGATWAGGTFVDTTKATGYRVKATFSGARLWWVAAIDAAGNVGTPASINISINTPSIVTAARAEVIDNNVLLYWSPSAVGAGQLPIDRYEVRKGATWAAGSVVGSNGNSTFASVFEQSAGAFTYWISPVDSAGTLGVAVGILAAVTQPPDYILRDNYDSPLTGAMLGNVTQTVTNFYADQGVFIGPVNTTQTWASHFSANGWTSPAAQVAAGFGLYAEPSLTSGSYEEVIDYGATIPATVVTATLATVALDGTAAVTCTLSYKLTAGAAWTVLPAGNSALLPSFRYVRVHFDVTCTAGANLIKITGLNVKLAIKQRSDSGRGVSASGGAAVVFGYPFLEADTPIVQAAGLDAFGKPYAVAVIFVGVANPTGFSVRIFNSAGTEVAGITFSWTVRGY